LETSAIALEARIEADHWWFQGRRRLLGALIRELGLSSADRVLDVGCGAGANLRLLSDMGLPSVAGLDLNASSIRFCREKGLGEIEQGDLQHLPFAGESFDLVLATDVLEHVDDDERAVEEIRRVLRPGGTALITVPAFPSMWGLQDEISHHRRRYRRERLLETVRAGGLEVDRSFYFNTILFAPIWLVRQVLRLVPGLVDNENAINTRWLNALLARIFALDVDLAPRLQPGFGVSLLAVTRRPKAS
jgi:SAM-dependent methyltransferase